MPGWVLVIGLLLWLWLVSLSSFAHKYPMLWALTPQPLGWRAVLPFSGAYIKPLTGCQLQALFSSLQPAQLAPSALPERLPQIRHGGLPIKLAPHKGALTSPTT